MPITLPPVAPAFGKQLVLLTDTAPAAPAAPTKAELNAMTAVQCHVYGRVNAQPTQAVVDGQRKGCSKVTPKRPGVVSYPDLDLQYSYLPQELGTPGAAGNEMYELAVPETTLYLYLVDGLDGEDTTVLATGDIVNQGFKVVAGEYREGATGDGEGDDLSVMQLFVPEQGQRLLHNYPTPAA